jgi:hypothetical protein
MSFELVSQRILSEKELALLEKASSLLRSGYDRRDCLRLMGLSGAVVIGSFLVTRPARAFVPVLIRTVSVAGPVALRSVIPAILVVWNSAASAARGALFAEYKDPTGLTRDQASQYIDVPARAEKTFRHNGFRAIMVGSSEYIATSDQNSEQDDFEVV